ncbi:MAG: DUF1883 domain-containing protein [Flavobacteriales bacterium]|nr:DUF1883 domain-containing protein [Flavobacteriales bacterium]
MRFLHKTFEAKRKEIIEVEIDQPTKVKFMTGKEMKAYKQGKTYSYFGGLFDESPVRFVVPFDSVWNVVVEKGTFRQPLPVKAGCQLLLPNNTVRSSVPKDAPPELRAMDADAEAIARELSMASRSEG